MRTDFRHRDPKGALLGCRRIHALDVARALAVFGMVANHLLPNYSPVEALSSGYPSSLFAVLAGVSLAIIGTGSGQGQQKLLLRGVILLVLGIVLDATQSIVSVVLGAIAMIYLLLGPVLRWSTKKILVLFAVLWLLGPWVTIASEWFGAYSDWLSGSYPLIGWLCYGLVGVLIHRHLLGAGAQWRLVVPLAGLGFGAAGVIFDRSEWSGEETDALAQWWSFAPHSGGVGDVAISSAMAVGIVAALLLLFDAGRAVAVALYPLRCVGMMSLTVYVCHVLSVPFLVDYGAGWKLGDEENYFGPAIGWEEFQQQVAAASGWDEYWQIEGQIYGFGDDSSSATSMMSDFPVNWWPFIGTVLVALVFCSLWRLFFSKGPLEWAVARMVEKQSEATSQIEAPAVPGGESGGVVVGVDKHGDDECRA